MNTIGSRIKHLRKVAKLTQEELADEISRETRTKITRGAVGNWELNKGIDSKNLVALAKVLNSTVEFIADGEGSAQAAPPLSAPTQRPGRAAPNASSAPPLPRQTRQRIPIRGQAVMGDIGNGRFILNEHQVGEIFAPPSLEAVNDAYAVYAHGDSMLERFRPGEILHVNPHRPVAPGDDVVIKIREDDGEFSGYVKRFKRYSATELVVEQLNPPEGEDREMRFRRSSVVSVHKIVGTGEG
nr:XRE family transcriptional regulator [Bradyrhizobium sp. Ai1a-2]